MKKPLKKLNLALQGGGSHGAFSWGVLDRLLEEEDLHIQGISGTSAGAMNGAVLVHGYMENGRDGAKAALEAFWREVSVVGGFASPMHSTPLSAWQEGWNLDHSAGYSWFDMMSRVFSPYELNPLNINPLKTVLERVIKIESLQACSTIQLFVAATSVHSGQPRVFGCEEMTIDVLLASACIPFLFQAVEIDGEPYWDGGYMGNPVIWPLVYNTPVEDVLLVQINPLYRAETPKRAYEIINRLNEINFNSSLIAEMRAINFVARLIKDNKLDDKKYKDVRMHMVSLPGEMLHLNASSKLNTSWEFFMELRDMGRLQAEDWLKHHKAHIGQKATVNIAETFLKPRKPKGKKG